MAEKPCTSIATIETSFTVRSCDSGLGVWSDIASPHAARLGGLLPRFHGEHRAGQSESGRNRLEAATPSSFRMREARSGTQGTKSACAHIPGFRVRPWAAPE